MNIEFPPGFLQRESNVCIYTPYKDLDDLIAAVQNEGWETYAGLKAWANLRTCYYYITGGMLHGSPYEENGRCVSYEDLVIKYNDQSDFLNLL